MTLLRSGSASDVGRVRAANEDSLLNTIALFGVADGMGGHAGGAVASNIAVTNLQGAFLSDPTTEGLLNAFYRANTAVWERSQSDPDVRGMGTTLTAVALVGDEDDERLVLANVGDSRAYLFRSSRLTQLTSDHSVAEELLARGELTEQEAAVHPQRHILTRALGVSPQVEVDLWEISPHKGDRFLLCSDGLTNELDDVGIAAVLASNPDPQRVADLLVAVAIQNGGHDNVTVVVIDVMVAPKVSTASAASGTGAGVAAGADLTASEQGASSGSELSQLEEIYQKSGSQGDEAQQGTLGPTFASTPDAAGAPGVAGSPGLASSPSAAGSEGDATGMVAATPGFRSASSPGAKQAVSLDDSLGVSLGASGGGRTQGKSVGSQRSARVSRKDRKARRGGQNHENPVVYRVGRRVITFRVVLFILVILGMCGGVWGLIKWYVDHSYFVALQSGQITIFQGRRGGFLGFQPVVLVRTGVATSQILQIHVSDLDSGVEEPTISAAKTYVRNLELQKLLIGGEGASAVGGTTGTSNAPATTQPNSTTTLRSAVSVAPDSLPWLSPVVGGTAYSPGINQSTGVAVTSPGAPWLWSEFPVPVAAVFTSSQRVLSPA